MDYTLTENIWDYLPKHLGYPSQEDRGQLLASAQKDPSQMRRVKIWDFFFPLNREIIVGPHQTELAKIRAEIQHLKETLYFREKETCAKISNHEETITRAQAAWTNNLPTFRSQMAQYLHAGMKSRRRASLAFFCAAGLLFILSAGIAFNSRPIDDAVQIGYLTAVIPSAIGLLFYVLSQKNILWELRKRELIQNNRLTAFVEWHKNSILALKYSQTKDKAAMNLLSQSALSIEEKIKVLEAQIPKDPSAEEVESWLMEEIEEIQNDLLQKSGQEGRLSKPRSGKNIFCIGGPVDIQQRDQIDPVYLRNNDLHKHLQARRACKTADGKVIDLYGVWAMEFLFLGQDELVTYRVFYDFISKHKTEQQRVHNYSTVTSVESRSQFREVEVACDGESKTKVVDDVPLLSISLENNQRMEVNFFNLLFSVKALPNFKSKAKLHLEPKREADEALKVLRENVHKARTRPKSDSEGSSLL